jgi:hypothetical protein
VFKKGAAIGYDRRVIEVNKNQKIFTLQLLYHSLSISSL